MTKRTLTFLLITALVITLFPMAAFAVPSEVGTNSVNATNISVVVNNNPANEKIGDTGWINWEQGVVKAIGTGAPASKAKTQAQAKILARRAAIVDAYRNLAETIQGLQVDSETTVENLEVTSDIIKTKVSAFIKGAQIVSEKQLEDGSFEVIMQVRVNGVNNLNDIIYDARPPQTQPVPQPSPEYTPPTTIATYTGVVIDARGLKLDRCFSPKVYDENGREVFGTMYVDPDFLSEHGLVSYAASPDMLRLVDNGQSRAGTNPIVVKALKVRDHNYNVVISKADADKILAANSQTGFLQKCAVVIKK